MEMVGAIQGCIHIDECALGLGEEIVDYAFAELALFLIVIHFEDLTR